MYPVYFLSKSLNSEKTLNWTLPPVRASQLSLAVLNVPVSSNDPEPVSTLIVIPLKFSAAALAAADGAADAAADGAADAAADAAADGAAEAAADGAAEAAADG